MRALLVIAVRNARSGLGRTMMTVAAVCLGVAFLAGSLSVSDTLARSLSVLFSSQYSSVDVVVRGERLVGAQRADLPESLVEDLTSVKGVAATAGIVEGFAQPMATDGSPLGSASQPGRGRTWVADPTLADLPMAAGRGPKSGDEVAMDVTTAKQGAVAVGDEIDLATSNGTTRMTVVGIVDVSSGTGSALTWLEASTAQKLLGADDLVQEIYVAADEGTTPDQLLDAVTAALPEQSEALTGTQAAEESQAKVESVFGFFKVILLVFVGIGLVVCAFIVYNTFAVLTAQRTKQLATLRALGARQRQVTLSTLAEGMLIGLLGSVLGVAIGLLMTSGLIWLISALGLGEISGGVVMRPATIAISVAVGLVVTLIGAYPPARDAGRAPPVSAMRDAAVAPREVSVGRIVAGMTALAIGLGLMGIGAGMGYPEGMAFVGAGGAALLLGLVLWGRPVLVGLVELLSPLAARFGLAGALAGRNSIREPKRTTVTAGSLALGLTLVSALGVLTASIKATLDEATDTSLTADVLVVPLVGYTPMPSQVGDAVRGVDEVAASSPILFDSAVIAGKPAFVTGVAADDFDQVVDMQMLAGEYDALADGKLLISQEMASFANLRVGQKVRAVFAAAGQVQLTVGGIFAENVYAGYYVLPEDRFLELSGKTGVWYVYANGAKGVSPDELAASVDKALKGTANTQAMTLAEYQAYQDELVDQAMAGIYFMLLFAVIVAVVGVANTVALSVSERTREIGMLRAIGMQRTQVGRMIRLEAVLTALAGAILGVIVGVILGATLRATMASIGFTTLAIPWATIGWFLVASALAGVLAALLPARKAARLNALEAIQAG